MRPRLAAMMVVAAVAALLGGWSQPAPPAPPAAVPAPAPTVSAAEAVVAAQLEAYNRRDLEGFLSFYADDAVLLDYPDTVTQVGKEAMRARYTRRFANPNVRAVVVKRIAHGDFVIDHEQITAPPQPGMIEAIAIYEVRNGKIVRVTFLGK
jgi:uncharacterized protein (TIGR02246 family)